MEEEIWVEVFPSSKKEKVEKKNKKYIVYVKEEPKEGKANKRVKELLAQFLMVPEEKVILIYGHRKRKKRYRIIKSN